MYSKQIVNPLTRNAGYKSYNEEWLELGMDRISNFTIRPDLGSRPPDSVPLPRIANFLIAKISKIGYGKLHVEVF